MKENIVFFGTSPFAASILEALNDQFEVCLVVSQPDQKVGRKQLLEQSPVALKAAELGLGVSKPENLKSAEVLADLAKLKATLFVVVAYGRILDQKILTLPKKGAINVHGSLLPKYRGASPIHAALLNGDIRTGITIMLMDRALDHGPILSQERVEIVPSDTFPVLEQKLLITARNLLLKTIPDYLNDKIEPQNQDERQASYTGIISKKDGLIDWGQDASKIYNQFRAYCLWPGIFTDWQGRLLKVTECLPSEVSKNLKPGKVFFEEHKIYVACQSGALEIIEIQLEGKKKTKASDFIRGHPTFLNATLG